MTEQHECKEFTIACEGGWEEAVVCKECGVPATSQEIIKSLHATDRLSAEDARVIADKHEGKTKEILLAYANILEGK